MKTICVAILLTINVSFLFSQNTVEKKLLLLKFTPSSLLNPIKRAWQFGAEYRLGKNYGLQIDYASNFNQWQNQDPTFCFFCSPGTKENKHHKWAGELRWYTPNNPWFFVAQEAFFSSQKYTFTSVYRQVGNKKYTDVDEMNVYHRSWGTATKIGLDISFNRVHLEMYAGYGARINANVSTIISEKPYLGDYIDDGLIIKEGDDDYSGDEFGGHISLGFRIGYVLVRRKNTHNNH